MWELDISGINEEVNCLKVYCEQNSDVNIEKISSLLDKLRDERMLSGFHIEENVVLDKNWNEEWEKNLNVIEISSRIVIKPTFRQYRENPGQIVITIDPKMSFGTGEHHTTRLMLQFLEKYVRKGDKVLDVGSGTGILAIASVKLGAASAIALDNDEWCLENGGENCILNKVEDKVVVRLGEINSVDEKDFDIILANIQKNVLMEIAGELRKRLAAGGVLILSGLLDSDENEIRSLYENMNLVFIEKNQLEEWIAVVFKNDG